MTIDKSVRQVSLPKIEPPAAANRHSHYTDGHGQDNRSSIQRVPGWVTDDRSIATPLQLPVPGEFKDAFVAQAPARKTPVTPAGQDEAIAPLPPPIQRSLRRRSYGWSLAGMVGLILFSSMGVVAYQWLTWLPPDPDCQNLPLLPPDSDRLYCAQQAAKDGNLDSVIAGIQLIKNWRSGHPMYRKAQSAMNEWSAALLWHAEAALNEESLETAVEIASHIPQGSPLYEEAQERIDQWQEQWSQGEAAYQTALTAIQRMDWNQASDQVSALRMLPQPYWRDGRANEVSLKIANEKTARQQLDQAVALGASSESTQIAEALSIVNKIQPQTAAWADAQPLKRQWSDALLQQGMEAIAQGDMNQAIELVQHVPIDYETDGEARNLLFYGYAQQLARFDSIPWQVNPFETWQLTEAIAAAQQISADSQFYGAAQQAIAQWQLELDNLGQLQLAQMIAQVGNRPALSLATRQAMLVEPSDPRRLQAQTLIAHWTQEIQHIINRPQLALAQRMAEPGTMEALKAAIAHLNAQESNLANWPQATPWMTQWTEQLQALEDRPILVAARELASDGKWREAIAQAQSIDAGRSLYAIAQDSIAEWQTELQLEIDADNLAQARALASRIRLTQAIHHASQIQPGQPLYREAQTLIGQWVAERERFRARQYAESAPTPTYGSGNSSNRNYEGYYDSRYYDYHRR